MEKKILVKYRGDLCPLNQKDAPSATGKVSKIQPRCKDCRPLKYTTERYKNSKETIQWLVKQHVQAQTVKMGGMFSKSDGPLQTNMVVYYKNTADFDAFDKVIFDALKGIAYSDDSLIKKGTVEIKENQPESGFDLMISQINPSPSLFDLPA